MKITLDGQEFPFPKILSNLKWTLSRLIDTYHRQCRGKHMVIELEVNDLPKCYTEILPNQKCISFFNNLSFEINRWWSKNNKIMVINNNLKLNGVELPNPNDVKIEVVFLSKIEDGKKISIKPVFQILTKPWVGVKLFQTGHYSDNKFYSSKVAL